jgi:hypothetical protein
MFLLRWRTALSVVLLSLVIPFASAAPTDGTCPFLFVCDLQGLTRALIQSPLRRPSTSLPYPIFIKTRITRSISTPGT